MVHYLNVIWELGIWGLFWYNFSLTGFNFFTFSDSWKWFHTHLLHYKNAKNPDISVHAVEHVKTQENGGKLPWYPPLGRLDTFRPMHTFSNPLLIWKAELWFLPTVNFSISGLHHHTNMSLFWRLDWRGMWYSPECHSNAQIDAQFYRFKTGNWVCDAFIPRYYIFYKAQVLILMY